jgi:dissimilatory sulfite reductase (desulfoviridin) alpha/beta subunit
MLICEREKHKGEGRRDGWGGLKWRKWEREKPIKSCLNEVWEFER